MRPPPPRARATMHARLALVLAVTATGLSCRSGGSAARQGDTASVAVVGPEAASGAHDTQGTSAGSSVMDGGTSSSGARPVRGEEAVALNNLVDEVTQRVSQVRGLSVLRPVERGVMDRAAIVSRLRERVREEYPPGEVELEAEVLRRLGMIPEDMDYERTVFDLLEEQVAGFYDPDERRLFVASWVPREMQVLTLSHEIGHALQDQHFNIGRHTHHARGMGDAQTAAMTVVEGDATVVMLEFGLAPQNRSVRDMPNVEQAMAAQMADTSTQPRLAAAPRAVREALLFPYRAGLGLCARLYRETGGFRAVDDLLRTPPESTEQVLHADKLRVRERPIAVPAVAPAPLAQDHVLAFDDVQGELGVRLFLQRALPDLIANEAAAGWGGDRAMLFVPRATGIVQNAGDAGTTLPQGALAQSALVWTLVFDPGPAGSVDSEAQAFERAAQAVLTARYPRGQARAVAGASRALETAPGRVALVARAGRTVVVLDRVPADRAAAIVRSAIAQATAPAGGAATTGATGSATSATRATGSAAR